MFRGYSVFGMAMTDIKERLRFPRYAAMLHPDGNIGPHIVKDAELKKDLDEAADYIEELEKKTQRAEKRILVAETHQLELRALLSQYQTALLRQSALLRQYQKPVVEKRGPDTDAARVPHKPWLLETDPQDNESGC